MFYIKEMRSPDELKECYDIIKELRPNLSFEDFIRIYKTSRQKDHYELVAMGNDKHIVAVMGYRFLDDFIRDRHVYIDDLVVTEKVRSQGYGAELLKYAEQIAKRENCKYLRLCTGIDNIKGMKFYERNGWIKRSHAYNKIIELS